VAIDLGKVEQYNAAMPRNFEITPNDMTERHRPK
jgi:hypothetical protein